MQLRDLHRQYEALKPEIDEAILAAVAKGAHIMGPQVAELEQRLAEYVGVKHCISCGNGTDALRMALMAWGIGPGDAVFVPDFTFFASAEVVALQGATPIFVDVCSEDYNIDPDDLVEKIAYAENHTDLRPAAVIAVDLFGQPADYIDIEPICRAHNMLLLEDGAQGFGGAIGGTKACSFGDIAITSFFPAKPLGCYGDGGALFTNNDEWAAKLRSLRMHGKGADKYDNVRIGLNSRLDTIQAAVLQVKLRHFDDELKAVTSAAGYYTDLLRGKITIPIVAPAVTSSWAQYTIQSTERDAILQSLRSAGIQSMVYYPRPMSRQTAFSSIGYLQQPCPVAEKLAQTVLSIPIGPYITDNEIETVVSIILGNAK